MCLLVKHLIKKKKRRYFWIEFHVSLITEWLNLITDTVSLNQLPNYILFENGTEVSRYPEVNFEPKIFSAPLTKVIFCLFSSWKYKETFIHVKLSIVDLTCFLLRYIFFFHAKTNEWSVACLIPILKIRFLNSLKRHLILMEF